MVEWSANSMSTEKTIKERLNEIKAKRRDYGRDYPQQLNELLIEAIGELIEVSKKK